MLLCEGHTGSTRALPSTALRLHLSLQVLPQLPIRTAHQPVLVFSLPTLCLHTGMHFQIFTPAIESSLNGQVVSGDTEPSEVGAGGLFTSHGLRCLPSSSSSELLPNREQPAWPARVLGEGGEVSGSFLASVFHTEVTSCLKPHYALRCKKAGT